MIDAILTGLFAGIGMGIALPATVAAIEYSEVLVTRFSNRNTEEP